MPLDFIMTYGVLILSMNKNLTKKVLKSESTKIITRKSFILCPFLTSCKILRNGSVKKLLEKFNQMTLLFFNYMNHTVKVQLK